MKEIIQSLEQIEKTVRGADAGKTEAAIQSARKALAASKQQGLEHLGEELSTWQKKLNVILKEPAGRQGMAKHVRYWIEGLTKASDL